MESAFFWYVTAIMVIAVLVGVMMPNPREHGYLQGMSSEALNRIERSPDIAFDLTCIL